LSAVEYKGRTVYCQNMSNAVAYVCFLHFFHNSVGALLTTLFSKNTASVGAFFPEFCFQIFLLLFYRLGRWCLNRIQPQRKLMSQPCMFFAQRESRHLSMTEILYIVSACCFAGDLAQCTRHESQHTTRETRCTRHVVFIDSYQM
jgi:hypothetical protein